jgi:hypothetical protein
MLSKPHYIAAAPIADAKAEYPWDEWHVEEAYTPPDEELLERYGALTHRAQIAMTIATAEWVVFRFEKLSDDPAPLQVLEAAWAANVDLAHSVYIEPEDDDWRGPIRGPLSMVISIVMDALYCADQTDDTAENPAWMSNLALRVLPEQAHPAFSAWRAACLERLEKHYTEPLIDDNEDEDDLSDLFSEEEDLGGAPVPREVFDPAFDFRPEMTGALIHRFLSGLDRRTNQFLSDPEDPEDSEDPEE